MTRRGRKRAPPRPVGAEKYLAKLAVLGASVAPGRVYAIEVLHDAGCPRLALPPGECTCPDPDLGPLKGAS